MSLIDVTVHLKGQSQPIVYHDIVNTYTKDTLYCLYTDEGPVHKYPVDDIFRVIEDYGTAVTTKDK